MLRKLVLSCFLLPVAAQAQRQVHRAPADTAQSRDGAAVARLEQQIEDAVVRRDTAFLDRAYAPSFRFKHSTGLLETRAQVLWGVRNAPGPGAAGRTISRDVDSLDVEVHGDVALTTGRIHVVRDGGDPHWRNYTVRYARVYARAGPGAPWKLLTHHSTAEAQGAPQTRP